MISSIAALNGIQSQLTLPALLLTALFAAFTIHTTYAIFVSPLRTVPGPPLAKISPLWRIYHILRGDWHEEIIEQHRKYGPYVRIAPNEVSTVSPSAIRLAYSHTGSPWTKDDWYQTWWAHPVYHPAFAETDNAKHRNQRRRVSKFYAMSYITGMEKYIDDLIQQFLDQMNSMHGQPVNLSKWTQFLTFDIVGELGFGSALECVAAGKDMYGLGHWVYMLMNVHASLGWTWKGAAAAKIPLVRWLVNHSLLRNVEPKLTAEPLPEFRQRLRQCMAQGPVTQRNNLVTQFQQMQNSDGSPVDSVEISIEIGNIVIAGADTTAVSLRAVIYYVASNRSVYRRLRREIDAAVASGKLSPLATFRESQEMEYLQLVIKEALRLHPAVGYQLPRVVPKGGAHVDNHFLPGLTILSTNGWALHRAPEIYGEDCEEFRPERWSKDQDATRLKLMEECYASFGFASRTCLGKNMGLMSLNRLVPTIMQQFEIEICYPQRPWIINTAWFAYSSEFYVRLISRRQSVSQTS